jgi:hypothetical protein
MSRIPAQTVTAGLKKKLNFKGFIHLTTKCVLVFYINLNFLHSSIYSFSCLYVIELNCDPTPKTGEFFVFNLHYLA